MSSMGEPAPGTAPAIDLDEAMALIEKGQQLAGHFPDAEALDRARRVLEGTTSLEAARAEIDAAFPHE